MKRLEVSGNYILNPKDPAGNRFLSHTVNRYIDEFSQFKDLSSMKSLLLLELNRDFGQEVYHLTLSKENRIKLECKYFGCPFEMSYSQSTKGSKFKNIKLVKKDN